VNGSRNAYAIAVAVALLIASILLVVYFVALMPAPDRYTNVYLLDEQGTTNNLPEYVVAGVNSTFTVRVDVANHMGRTLTDAQVQVKVTSRENPTIPVNSNATILTFTGTIQDGETWENNAPVSLTQPGDFLVVFELWTPSVDSSALQFSGNYCVLNVQVGSNNTTEAIILP
jgi:uncharacterized membrane protein